MRSLLAALLTASALACAAPAFATTVTANGTSDQDPGVSPASLPTTTTANVGDTLVVVTSQDSVSTTLGVNTLGTNPAFSCLNAVVGSGGTLRACSVVLTQSVASGVDIVCTYSDTATPTQYKRCVAAIISGSTTLDVNGTGANGTSASPSYTSGPTSSANAVVIGFANEPGTNNPFTEASGYTNLGQVVYGGRLMVGYKVVSATGTQTYNPIIGSSSNYQINIAALDTSGGGPTVSPRGMFTGIFP